MMSFAQAASALGAGLSGLGTKPTELRFTGVSTDSRNLRANELFVALRGERYDGHAFLAQVAAKGAAGAMVDVDFDPAGAPLPLIVVADTRLGLGALAAHWRARFSPALVAIAGSNGKTTTKEMLASILHAAAEASAVLATEGNLNNDIGLPLTLLRLRNTHRLCAIELGMNHKGEIAMLSAIAHPTVALVTNAQREHLEFMGSIDEVAEENAAVIRALPPEGVAVINADDAHAQLFRDAAGARRRIEFSMERDAIVSASSRPGRLSSHISVRTPAGVSEAHLAIPGQHNVRNALAAAACAFALGIGPESIAAGLSLFRPYSGRLQVKPGEGGITVIDDSYNANPDSVRAAIDVLADTSGTSILVLGDMGEVGEDGPDFHAEVGRYARERGVGAVLALGESTAHTVAAFGEGSRHFANVEDLIEALKKRLDDRTTVLVKGSRFMRMERVVAALTGKAMEAH